MFASHPLIKAVVCVAGWGGLPQMGPPRMMSATAFSTWSLCGRCVSLRVAEQQLKICGSVLLLRHWGHGGDSARLLKNRPDRMLQRQWINLRKFWSVCIETYFSHHFPICFFSIHSDCIAHYFFSSMYVIFLWFPYIPWVTIDQKYVFSTPFTHQ